jgi:hypothetical protein
LIARLGALAPELPMEKVEQETLQRQLESRLRRCLEDDGDRITQVSSDLNTTPTPQKP